MVPATATAVAQDQDFLHDLFFPDDIGQRKITVVVRNIGLNVGEKTQFIEAADVTGHGAGVIGLSPLHFELRTYQLFAYTLQAINAHGIDLWVALREGGGVGKDSEQREDQAKR